MKRPGVGVIIQNEKDEILIGKRRGSHSPYYSIPGGHLENRETFVEAAIKEVLEETGLLIKNPIVICVTNNLKTFKEAKKHYVSINLFVDEFEGQCEVKEPNKCEGWIWCQPDSIPQPHFDACEYAINCFVQDKFYLQEKIE